MCDSLMREHQAQLFNYLKVASLQVGLLINFRRRNLEWIVSISLSLHRYIVLIFFVLLSSFFSVQKSLILLYGHTAAT